MNIVERDMMNIVDLSACELSNAIHSHAVSCVEVMQAYLQRIHTVNPSYNAIVSLRPDELLLQEAAAKDAMLARGQSQGWMHGFPQAPKDLTATAGLTTTMGFRGMANHVPTHDSVVAARMRAAGSVFIGKTNTPEFGLGSHTYNAVFGATGNAFNPQLSAGGSSGGAAVALAQRLLPVADGSDMMGSLRNPAAWNGMYGLRPSMGRVPYGAQTGTQTGTQAGIQTHAQTGLSLTGDVFFQQLGIEGPMGRCIEDVAQLLAVQAGADLRAPLSLHAPIDFTARLDVNLKDKRIAWLGDLNGHLAIEPALATAYEQSLSSFGTLGCRVEAARLQIDLDAVWQAWLTLRGMTVAGNLAPLATNSRMQVLLKPEALWEYEQGQRYSALDLYKASAVRSALYAAFLSLFEQAQVDYIVLPATQCMPFALDLDWPKAIAGRAMDTYHRWMECTIYATLAGLPALAVPAGVLDGIPFGYQIIGKPQGEWALLQLGYAWQQVQPTVRPNGG
jgi:amidase